MTDTPPSAVLNYEPPPPAAPPAALRRTMLLVTWGIFVTTLGQTVTIGDLPLRVLLKDRLGVTPTGMAMFFMLANLAWYFKPITGLLSDSFPLLGTRRRHYLMFGSIASAIGWGVMAIVPRAYASLLMAAIAVNVCLVVVSSAVGGLLVEEGQKLGATGRLSSARSVVMYVAVFLVGPTGGWLATHAFGLTAGITAAILLSYVPIVWFFLPEPPTTRMPADALRVVGEQLKRAFGSRGLWAAAGLLFLVHLSPGFQTPLYYRMTNELKFSSQFIGIANAVSGAAGILASLLYAWVIRRMTLRRAYFLAVAAAALGALPFLLLQTKASAIWISFVYSFGLISANVASLDLAARATPKQVEATGYALVIGFWNLAVGISEPIGTALHEHAHVPFRWLIFLNASSTAIVLLFVPLLPSRLVDRKEGIRTP